MSRHSSWTGTPASACLIRRCAGEAAAVRGIREREGRPDPPSVATLSRHLSRHFLSEVTVRYAFAPAYECRDRFFTLRPPQSPARPQRRAWLGLALLGTGALGLIRPPPRGPERGSAGTAARRAG